MSHEVSSTNQMTRICTPVIQTLISHHRMQCNAMLQIPCNITNILPFFPVKFLSAALITTNIDNYYPTLCQPYADGFIMKQFQAIPYVQTQAALSFSLKVPYEAMLCKPINM